MDENARGGRVKIVNQTSWPGDDRRWDKLVTSGGTTSEPYHGAVGRVLPARASSFEGRNPRASLLVGAEELREPGDSRARNCAIRSDAFTRTFAPLKEMNSSVSHIS